MEITQEKYMLNLMVIHKEKAIQCCDREGVGVEGDTYDTSSTLLPPRSPG